MSSRVKSSRKPAKVESDLETSDDDYVDPSMDVYFKKKDKNDKGASSNGAGKLKLGLDESESEEEEEEEVEESEEEDLDDVELDDDEEKEAANGDVEMKEEDKEEDDDDGRTKITLKMIKVWSKRLASDNPYQAINETVKAFKSALLNVVPNRKSAITKYRVDGPEMFNAMMRVCMRDLLPCWLRLLDLSKQKQSDPNLRIKLASSGSNWKKIRSAAKSYMEDLIILITNIHQAEILNALLRHVRLLINFYLCFPKLVKSLIKLLIAIWSQKDDKSRVIAFVCLHTITANIHEKNQSLIFKSIYLAFARNSKFTSVNTLPQIGFMQRSIVEIYSLNDRLAYEHTFVYIRQLAIHLRNAMSLKKKESYQAVYNWQYMHSLILWSKFLSTLVKTNTGINQHLQPLVYPVVQCLIGTIKLVPTPRYYPLRLHCVNALIALSNATDVFIPIIPFILEIFDITDFNKKHATISVKSLNFSFLLKLNKQQMQDKAFKDTLIDLIYDSLILLLQHQSHDIAFPELVLPLIVRLKDFVKKCKNGNYCKVVKGLLDKIQENCKYIEERRSKVTFSLKDKKQVDLWAEKNKELGTPLSNWYNRYKVAREREIMMEHTEKEAIGRSSVLEIREKPDKMRPELEASKEEDKRELGDLFVNWSDEEDEDLADSLDFVPKKSSHKSVEAMNDEEEESEDDFADVIQSKKKAGDSEDDE